MGAIARQVLQVKRKNSTNWTFPEARLTVLGSMASRLGPREVATGKGVGASSWVGPAAGWDTCSAVRADGGGSVAVGATITGPCATAGGDAGAWAAHAAISIASKLREEVRRVFIIISLYRLYQKILTKRLTRFTRSASHLPR